jgi:glutathione S-transferase
VDAFFAPVAYRLRTYGLEVSPESAAYAQRLRDLPSMQRWEADGLAETFREPEHEKEIEALGEIIEDFRAT